MASKKTFEARQRTWLRYVASVGPEVTAKDAGVSQSTLKDFLQSTPTKRASEKKSYQSLISARPTVVAKEHNRKLVHSLSQKEYQRLENRYGNLPPKTVARIRVTRATHRQPTRETREEAQRRQANRFIISEGLTYTPVENFTGYQKSRLIAAYGKSKK